MGERLNISLDKGVHRTPTIGEEGQLSECVNMIPRNGQLTPLRAPSEHYHYASDRYHLLYIHENAGYKHYIHAVELTDNLFKLYWSDDDPAGEIGVGDMTELTGVTVGSLENIYHISHIGNTVIFLTDSGVKMQVFKGDGYKYLSGQIPEINLSFGLKTWLANEFLFSELDSYSFDNWSRNSDLQDLKQETRDEVNQIAKAKINSMLSTIHSEGYWTFPFFIRYALVMKDGTLIHCSAPVLMTPCTDNPLCTCNLLTSNNLHIYIAKSRIEMMFDALELQKLQQYGDIIDRVAIYVSEQIWTYDQDGEYKQGRWAFGSMGSEINTKGGISFGKAQEIAQDYSGIGLDYEPSTIVDLMYYKGLLDGQPGVVNPVTLINFSTVFFENPRKDINTIDEEIKYCQNFYLLKEYTLDELASLTDTSIEIAFPSGRISNISSFKRMAEEMELRDYYIAQSGYTYNRRLNISNIKYKLNNSLAWSSLVNHITKTGRVNHIYPTSDGLSVTVITFTPTFIERFYQQKVQVKHDGQVRIINNSETPILNLASGAFYYLAVPFVGANKIWIHSPQTTTGVELPLAQHDLLDVSYYYQGFGDVVTETTITVPDDNDDYLTKNALMQSLVENPWVFPKELEAIVGNGQIIGMAAAIKALSVGQYGQFPLVVFATDGIWTLQINDDGTYKPATFLSGDVCTNPASITQTDNAVLFVTKQGLKIVDGSNVILLSKPIEGVDIPDSTFVPMGTGDIASRWAGILVDDTTDRRLSLQDCKCLFDYTDSLLHIFNDTNKHYCLELNGQEFASEVNNVQIWESGYGEAVDTNPFDVAECDGDYLIFIESDDVEISPDGKDGFITDDRLLSTDLRFRWEWSLDHGKLRTKNRTFGGSTRDIIDVVLQVDVSVCDGSDNVLANYSGQFDVHNDGEAIDVPSAEFVIHSDDIHYIDNDGPVKIKFQSLSYIVAVDGTMGEGEYFAPQLSLTTTIGYESASGETHQGKLGKPSRIITRNPESLFQVGTQVFSYAGYDSEAGERLGYLITRPVAFGDFAKYKTILDIRIYDQIIEKGTVSTGNGTWMLLFGSNNERQWYRLNSLHGSSFKFFRLALVTSLGKDDTISGVSIEYEERRGTKMR